MSEEGVHLALKGFTHASELGRGGFGVVYRAWETVLRRWVAIKVLELGRLDESARARFTHELRAAARVSTHPNIVTIYAHGFDGAERPCIVMEWMAKGALRSPEVPAQPWPWQRVAETGVKLCGALQAVHRVGIVHQDIKPENLFLSEYDEPAIGDFGASVSQNIRSTDYPHLYLTIAHAAPELLDGTRPDPRVDIYALASSLMTLLRGVPPFSSAPTDTPAVMLERIRTSAPPDLRPLGVPDLLCTTLERALAKDPTARPQSAAEFGEALRSAQQAAGFSPTPMVVSSLPLAALTAPTATTYEVVTTQSSESPGEGAEPRRRPSKRLVVAALASAFVLLGGASTAAAAVLLSRHAGFGTTETRSTHPGNSAALKTPSPRLTPSATPTIDPQVMAAERVAACEQTHGLNGAHVQLSGPQAVQQCSGNDGGDVCMAPWTRG